MALRAAWLSGISTKPKPRERPVSRVGHNPGRLNRSIRLEELTQILLRRGKSQVTHKMFTHGSPE
jgi:hypothetical protein